MAARDAARFAWCKKEKTQKEATKQKWCGQCRRRAQKTEEAPNLLSLRAYKFVNVHAAEEYVKAQNGWAWEVVQGHAAGMRGASGMGGRGSGCHTGVNHTLSHNAP